MGESRDAAPFLLFDLGGVLIENVGFDHIKRWMPEVVDTPVLKQRWLASPHVRAFELGQIAAAEFAIRLVDDYQLRCSPQEFLEEFTLWPRGFYDGALELMRTLRERHRIGCLTNSNALHWARFGAFANEFDVALSSHLTGVIKPDAECFRRTIEACGVPASQIVFFDDSMPNVIGAREAGLQAWHVNGLNETRSALRSMSLA
jgi:HAD superfamily hydrolase (TIGR01509 family)